jgi:hypothetical protein
MGRGFVAAMQESELWEVAAMYDIPEDKVPIPTKAIANPPRISSRSKPLSLPRVGSR